MTTEMHTQPDPRIERTNEVQAFYQLLYGSDHEDSPYLSRVSINERLNKLAEHLPTDAKVLDIGAGIQIAERMYEETYGKPPLNLTTLDFAAPQDLSGRLLAEGIDHVLASGTHMPFSDKSFDVLISNMALDFMPTASLGEVSRILTDDGHLILNLHHPDMIPKDLHILENQFARKTRFRLANGKPLTNRQFRTRAYLNQMRFLSEGHILYESEGEIRDTFEPLGFEIRNVEYKTSGEGPWWEADMRKVGGGVKNA